MSEKKSPMNQIATFIVRTVWITQVVLIVLRGFELIETRWIIVFLPTIALLATLALLALIITVFSGGEDD